MIVQEKLGGSLRTAQTIIGRGTITRKTGGMTVSTVRGLFECFLRTLSDEIALVHIVFSDRVITISTARIRIARTALTLRITGLTYSRSIIVSIRRT